MARGADRFTGARTETLLVRELAHRVADDWSSAMGAVSIIARSSDDPKVKAALDDVSMHLSRHADLLRALEMPEDDSTVEGADYLARVCMSISRSKLEWMNIRLILVTDPLPMEADRCWRLGMIVAELVTNASRHVFHRRDGGIIRVDLRADGSDAECRIFDNGLASDAWSPGRGVSVVEELVRGLGGTFRRQFGAFGPVSIVKFPI